MFRRLAVFLGGCTVEAVETVCNPDGSLGIDVLEGLISLVDKSLLRQREGVGGEPRFTMLEMIHEYGRDKLLESGEQDVVKRRHAQYFAEVAEAAELKVWGPKEKRALDRLEEEHDNMRAALQWSHSTGGDVEIELRLVVALGRFWEFRGYLSEGRERLAAALSKPESKEEKVKLLRAWALTQTNQLAFWQADYPVARSVLEEAITLFRELGDRQGLARAITDMCDIVTGEGDYEKSLVVATESLEINRSLADAQGTVISLVSLGWSEMYLGNYTRAAPHMEEAVALARKIDVPHRTALAVSALGELRVRQGKYEQAILLLEEGLAIRRRIGHRSHLAATLGTIALAALRQTDYERATELLVESLGMRKELRDRGGAAWCLEKFAQIESAVGDAARAARLLGAAQAMRETLGTEVDVIDRDEYDQTRSAALHRLGEEVLLEIWKEGQSMSMDQAIEFALD